MEAHHKKHMWEIMTWLREHLDEPLTVGTLAARANMSERHFHRVFEKVAGESPAEHVQRLRLARGAAWLAYTDAPVVEAAAMAGYESREAFSRLFTRHYGCTPKAYRMRLHEHTRNLMKQSLPPGLRILGMETLQPMTLVAWPHVGHYLSGLIAWHAMGVWAKKHSCLDDCAVPVSVMYDDSTLSTTPARERYDAALLFSGATSIPDDTAGTLVYTLPGGPCATAEFTGNLNDLEAAWDYFGFVWFLDSGLQMRDSRLLTFFRPADVPATPMQMALLLAGKHISCKCCIPVDGVAGEGIPMLNSHEWKHTPPHR